jgi:dTDP-4-dehydrorhamnose 3,5-epimerase
MEPSPVIHDLFIKPLKSIDNKGLFRLPILSEEDHLLRKFGFAEFIHLQPGHMQDLHLRLISDEVWALLEGQVLFAWWDRREHSPTRGQRYQRHCAVPALVLAPFGVAFGMRALDEPALLLRIATHPECDEDKRIAWKEVEWD